MKFWTVDMNIAQMTIPENQTPHMKNAIKNYEMLAETITVLERESQVKGMFD